VLANFGVEIPKPPRTIPRSVEIGAWRGNGEHIRLDRAPLFDRIWSEPVENLAKAWGLSGRGLAKACRRLKIPVPPRGFWAKVRGGQRVRRPELPEVRAGEAEEIVIYAGATRRARKEYATSRADRPPSSLRLHRPRVPSLQNPLAA
jgi:hypothetical protein